MKWMVDALKSVLDLSPPSRGAWIEIILLCGTGYAAVWSPPSRGAWIEIIRLTCLINSPFVAPLAGGVD